MEAGDEAPPRNGFRLESPPMARKALLSLGAAAAAAAVAAVLRRRRSSGPATNGGRERTEELRREIESARARLRESISSQDG